MKLFSVEQIRAIEKATIEREPISSVDLMERAGEVAANWLVDLVPSGTEFHVYVGMGNNGGDGLVIARRLKDSGFAVRVFIIAHRSKGSAEFDANLKRIDEKEIEVSYVSALKDMPVVDDEVVAVDSILGIGLDKPLRGILSDVVKGINEAYEEVISIDIPTGMPADWTEGYRSNRVVEATHTLTFQFPKLSFLLPGIGEKAGDVHVLDIGLDEEAIYDLSTDYHLTTEWDLAGIRPERHTFTHKGEFGHALLVAGREGMMGAAVLATRACLRSGAGLVTAHVPQMGRDVLQLAAPEAMVQSDHGERSISNVYLSSKYTAIGFGPGLGSEQSVLSALSQALEKCEVPVVLDADALNTLSSAKAWESLPVNSVLTPHPGEFKRMLGEAIDDPVQLLHSAVKWAKEHQCIVVLKGAYTAVCHHTGEVFFNSTGHPAMAAGGTGDVLTGLLTGLLAQGIEPIKACRLGVWLHGYAGEEAAHARGSHAVTASDIIDELF